MASVTSAHLESAIAQSKATFDSIDLYPSLVEWLVDRGLG